MRRALVAIVLLAAFAAGPPAGAAPGTGVADSDTVGAPRVGFDPLLAPWWVRNVAVGTGDKRTLTALYLADGGTPETGRGFALVRSRAVAGADLCGGTPTPLDLRGGPFARADLVQNTDTLVVRRAGVRAGAAVTLLVARGLTPAEVRDLASQLRVIRGVLAPRTIPNDLHLAGLAPVDATLTGGPGTELDLVGGIAPDRRVALHAAILRGPAGLAARFFRTTSVGMACTPDRFQVVDRGNAVIASTSSGTGDAAAVARMARRVDAKGFAEVKAWASRPGVTQLARRCNGAGIVTIAGDNHGRVWGVGVTPTGTGPTCVASRGGGTTALSLATGTGPVRVAIRHRDTCGLALVAGSAPGGTRRVVVHSGRFRPQVGHLRIVGLPTNGTTLWAALVRTAPVAAPAVTVTAYDRRGKAVGRVRLAAGSSVACRPGHRI